MMNAFLAGFSFGSICASMYGLMFVIFFYAMFPGKRQ